MGNLKNLSWTCHICGKTRPDDKISVISKPILIKGKVCGSQNIRYCNDNPKCREGAQKFDLLTPTFDRVITFVKEMTDQDKIPSAKEVGEYFGISSQKARVLLEKGVREETLAKKYHPNHRCYYYAYIPMMEEYARKKHSRWRRLYNWFRQR